MPTNNGNYTLPPVYKAEPGTTIRSEQHNVPLEDLAVAMNGTIARDGTRPPTANLNMGGRKITGLATGTGIADAVRLDQVPVLGPFLTATAQLTFAANQFPYATGPSTVALGTVSAFGRTLIDDADAAAARATLGLGSLATVTPTGTANATTFLRGDNSWSGVVGLGQTAQNVTSSRVAGTIYQNTTGRPIMVYIEMITDVSTPRPVQISSNGTTWVNVGRSSNSGIVYVSFMVPVGFYYRVESGTFFQWNEVR